MRNLLRGMSAALAAAMLVTASGITSFAESYTDTEVYYNDFTTGNIQTTTNRGNAYASIVDLSSASLVNLKRGNNAVNAAVDNGKLKITSNGSVYNESAENLSRTFIKFDKDFDITGNAEKKLIVSYDIDVTAFNLASEGQNIISYMIGGGLFQYTDASVVSKGVFSDESISGNASNIGMALQIPAPQSGTAAEKAGLLIKTGNSFTLQTAEGPYKAYSGGIFNRPIGNVYHVVYEVTPGTDSTNARVSRIIVSDSEYTMDFTVPNDNQYFNITGKTAVSGLSFNTWLGADYEIDNVKAYYEGTITAPTASYNGADLNGVKITGNSAAMQINFTQPISSEECSSITVNNGAEVSLTLSDDRKTVTAEVSGLEYEKNYILNVPETALNSSASFTFETEKSPMYVQDFSNESVKTVVNRSTAWSSIVDLSTDNIVNMKRTNDGVNAAVEDGKLKITSNGMQSDSGELLSRTFVRFNKDYDISSAASDNLIVAYDIAMTGFEFSDTKDYTVTEGYTNFIVSGGLFQYINAETASNGVFENVFGSGGNASSIGMSFQIPMPAEGRIAEKSSLLIRTGNSMNLISTEGTYKGFSAGIFNRPMGNTYHVVYEITPATAASEARISKITISDSKFTQEFDTPTDNIYFNITGKTAVSGIKFNTWQGIDYEIDNISVGYDWAFNAPMLTYGANNVKLDGSVIVDTTDKTFKYTVSENNEIKDLSGITLKDENENTVAASAAIDGNTVTINVTGDLNTDTNYVLDIPYEATGTVSSIKSFPIRFKTKWAESEFTKPSYFADNDGLNVVFIGGSVTADVKGYRNDVMDMISSQYPASVFTNSGVGGTGSDYGWTRLKSDVIDKNPDVVFVEFTLNDRENTDTNKSMESIVRNLNALENPPVIIFICMSRSDFEMTRFSQKEHEALAKAYNIPVITVGSYMESLCNANEQFKTDWDNLVYLTDAVHPSEECSRIYGGYINNILKGNEDKYFVLPKLNSEVTPLTDYKNYVYDYTAVSENDNSLTFKVYGDDFRLQYYQNVLGVKFNVVIDGNDMGNIDASSQTNGTSQYSLMYTKEYSNMGNTWHTVKVTAVNDGDILKDTVKGLFRRTAPEDIFEIAAPVFNAQAVTENSELTATVSYTGTTEKKLTVFIAVYTADGRLTRVISKDVTSNTAAVETDEALSITPVSGDTAVKAFVWESLKSAKPVTAETKIGN